MARPKPKPRAINSAADVMHRNNLTHTEKPGAFLLENMISTELRHDSEHEGMTEAERAKYRADFIAAVARNLEARKKPREETK